MTITDSEWADARRIVRRAVVSSLHCSVASLNSDGTPQVTPIGSLVLTEVGHGIYFDAFNVRLAANVDRDPRVAVLAVDSRRLMWARSLVTGRFADTPGVRLVGTVGPARRSAPDDVHRFHRVVGPLLRTPGGAALWRRLPVVRDIEIDQILPIRMGSMTLGLPDFGTAKTPAHPSDVKGGPGPMSA